MNDFHRSTRPHALVPPCKLENFNATPASVPSSTSIHRFGIDVKSRLRVNNFASVGNSGSVAIRCRLETLLGKVWFNRGVINAVNLLRFRPIVPPLRPLSPPSTAPRWPRNLESDSIAYNLRHPPIVIYSIDGIFGRRGRGDDRGVSIFSRMKKDRREGEGR